MQCNIYNYNDMPKIFEYFGLIFYFYSNEHEPVHVHVKVGENESVFELIMMEGKLSAIKTRHKTGILPLSGKDEKTAKEFIEKYHKNILEKWFKFFVMKQAIRSTRITKKI